MGIDDVFGGRGLAGILTRAALRTSVDARYRMVPVCPYMARWLRDHHEVDVAEDGFGPSISRPCAA